MTPERWRQVTEVFHAALARDAADRASCLDQACAADRALREEVEAMLAAHLIAGDASLTPTPRLGAGTMIGPYRVAHLIGAGGMGEVYRARDTKLGRDVALKVLPTAFTADADRLARFEREARMLAALNHPHIAAIYGIEDATEVCALVLELAEGDTLADRLARGPIPLDRGARDRAATCGRARGGTREGDHPSRSEAREHQNQPAGRRQGARLRVGQGVERGRRGAGALGGADSDRHGHASRRRDGHARLHES